jgi:3-oxoacyl-[acyl-carrier-protein] synthase-3
VEQAGLTVEDVDLFIPHQANIRIILSAAATLGIPPQRTFVNVDHYGNTSAASIPIALCEAVENGRVPPGANVLLAGFGGGLTWGAAVLRWAAT